MESALCHSLEAYNFEVAPTVLENLCMPHLCEIMQEIESFTLMDKQM
jgi:hypothetical protein